MSERTTTSPTAQIDVDAAFDSEKRQAQADYDAYLNSRDYQDTNGSLHDAESGRFKSDPNTETDEGYYNRMVEESSSVEDQRFAGKSLKDLASMVRDARLTGDKTLENDARAVFDDKFIETAEKYDWEGTRENSDGTVDDRNEIADRKLAYYESIMAGDDAETEVIEPAKADTPDASDKEAPLDIDTSWTEEKDPGEDAALERTDEGEATDDNDSDKEAPLDIDTSWTEEKDPGEDAALEREPVEETEEDYVVTVDTRNKLNKANAELRNFVKNPTQYLRTRLAELRGTPETREKRSRRIRRVLGVSALTGVFIAPMVLSADSGEQAASLGARGVVTQQAGHTTNSVERTQTVSAEQKKAAQTKPTDLPRVFSQEARMADDGEGWYETFDEMGIDSDKQAELLAVVGPQLKKMKLAYFDGAHNEWRISHQGKLPQEALDLIADTAKNL